MSDQHQPMTAAVMAVAAAQVVALGEACMQISLDHQVDKLDWQDVSHRIEQMAAIKDQLLEWGELTAKAIIERTAAWKAEADVSDQQFWPESAAEISQLTINAAILLQDFRPLTFEMVQDDLEITINLLLSIARTAILSLENQFRRQPNVGLVEEYEPIRDALERQLEQITPAIGLRNE
ncbi:MAG: hypothetical protein JXM69_17610 [Anaerolineae bacterium]|nr:hypothetical protein [Anaerolineae bacterium]